MSITNSNTDSKPQHAYIDPNTNVVIKTTHIDQSETLDSLFKNTIPESNLSNTFDNSHMNVKFGEMEPSM